MNVFKENTPLTEITLPLLTEHGVQLFIKRDDLIHSEVSGNKWRKLKHNISKFNADGKEVLITFGGAFSNHIAATAAAGKLLGIRTIGIIRGEELEGEPLNKTLSKAKEDGMELRFVSREDYKACNEKWYHEQLHEQFPNAYIVPEGGANYYGIVGCTEIVKEIDSNFDYIVTACGTGTTLAGLIIGLQPHQKALGFSALKGNFMQQEINEQLNNFFLDWDIYKDYQESFSIYNDYHFGGYGKTTPDLLDFMEDFKTHTGIELDKIYTAKMVFGLLQEIKQGAFDGKTIIALHTGGLQGN